MEIEEFEIMQKIMNNFKTDLKVLIEKYNITIHESDNYDGMDEYHSTTYYFGINGKTNYIQTMFEVLEDCII